jgi:hypothetical protein
MPELKVFISSTYEDLRDCREKIIDFFRDGLPDILFKGMETMPASDERPIDVCRQRVEESNVFILVVGKRYGWIPTDAVQNPQGLSITELEYEWAKRYYADQPGNTLLCFVADKNTDLPGDKDADPQLLEEKKTKLTAFIRKVQSEAGIVPTKGFMTADDLVKQINKALWNRYTNRHSEKQLDREVVYCCNRDDNYRIFKTAPRPADGCNLFLAVGSREDLLENFFQRIIIFDYHGTPEKLKALPPQPQVIDSQQCLRQHIEKIAFEIDPLRSTASVQAAVANCRQHGISQVYFKTDVSAMEIAELEGYVQYLQQLLTIIRQEVGPGSGVSLLLFIYTNQETLHRQLAAQGCVQLGDFGDVVKRDIENWLGAHLTTDSGMQQDILEKCILEPGEDVYDFQYTMKQAEKKLRLLIKQYNDKDASLMQWIN